MPFDQISLLIWTQLRLTISESVGNIAVVLLCSPYTAQLNMFTSSCVYSAFPTFVGKARCLKTDRPLIVTESRPHPFNSFTYQATNADWGQSCGVWCPALNRKTRGDKGMASFMWNEHTDYSKLNLPRHKDVDWLMGQSVLVWRFGSCLNKHCPNWAPRYRRAVSQPNLFQSNR